MPIVRFRRDELLPLSEESKAELRALNDLPDGVIDDPEMPEITDVSGWMTVQELEAYLAAKKNQGATV